MVFSEYITHHPVQEEDENEMAEVGESIKDLPVFGDRVFHQTKSLPYVSKAELERVKSVYYYLFDNQDVTYKQFYGMLEKEPKYKEVLKRYPSPSFEETLEELMEQGPKRFAEAINAYTETKLDKQR